jgi:hypothetical protein
MKLKQGGPGIHPAGGSMTSILITLKKTTIPFHPVVTVRKIIRGICRGRNRVNAGG